MDLVDANVLLYAVNEDSRHHEPSRSWLDARLSGGGAVAFTWIAVLAFLRLSTKDGLFPQPLEADTALDIVESWLQAPAAVVLEPTVDHLRLVRRMLAGVGTGGNLVNDAHLAALAVEWKCAIVSYDSDFGRFDGVRWRRPGD